MSWQHPKTNSPNELDLDLNFSEAPILGLHRSEGKHPAVGPPIPPESSLDL